MMSDNGRYASLAPTGMLMARRLAPEVLWAEPVTVPASAASARRQADRMLTEIYAGEYRSLVRLAMLLLNDVPTAEDVVQEAFIAVYSGWWRLRNSEKALAYLRRTVINRSRSELRHRAVARKYASEHVPDGPSAESGAIALLERSSVIAAMRRLPDRQREAIVLRYYADQSEAEIAAAMGISRGAVKSHSARGMAALKSALEQEPS
jgi:RNA polymerase sigma-70 factor (sigma-E family)